VERLERLKRQIFIQEYESAIIPRRFGFLLTCILTMIVVGYMMLASAAILLVSIQKVHPYCRYLVGPVLQAICDRHILSRYTRCKPCWDYR
jgi:ABC-type transport system involved in cytochrome bd biosynthesis fused ATPase/permease subunit